MSEAKLLKSSSWTSVGYSFVFSTFNEHVKCLRLILCAIFVFEPPKYSQKNACGQVQVKQTNTRKTPSERWQEHFGAKSTVWFSLTNKKREKNNAEMSLNTTRPKHPLKTIAVDGYRILPWEWLQLEVSICPSVGKLLLRSPTSPENMGKKILGQDTEPHIAHNAFIPLLYFE